MSDYDELVASVTQENKALQAEVEALRLELSRLEEEVDELTSQEESFKDAEQSNRTLANQAAELERQYLVLSRELKSLQERRAALTGSSASVVGSPESAAGGSLAAFFNQKKAHSSTEEQKVLEAAAEEPPGPVLPPDEDGIMYGEYKGKVEIKGGTKEKLVSKLYLESEFHEVPTYVATFLLTYRSFMKPNEVLDLLIQEYNNCIDGTALLAEGESKDELSKRRIRICNFLKRWVENFFHDFERDAELVAAYNTFVANMHGKGEQVDQSLAQLLEKAMTRKHQQQTMPRTLTFDEAPPTPVVPEGPATIETVEPVELARQLSLQEHEMLRNIAPKELLNLSWSSKQKEEKSPNVLRMIRRFNKVSGWVTSTIVAEPNLKKRQAIVKKFIKTAEECLKLNNFNAIFEITSGLNASSVYRLQRTWDGIRGKRGFYENVQQQVTSNKQNFKLYKQFLANADPPCVPYLGVYLSSLTFIEEGNKDFLDNGYVNFYKRRLVSEVIKEIQTYQHKPYNFSLVPTVAEFIDSAEVFDESKAFQLSLVCEPRESS